MSLLQWPFKRKQYAGIDNPRFVSDVVAANESVLDGLKSLAGLSDTDFAIISGLEFTGTGYTPGVFFLNGTFYYIQNSFNAGLYVIGAPQDTMAQPFGDGNNRNIYTIQYGVSTSSPTDASPVFTGDMNQYRIGAKQLRNNISALNATAALLGDAAFKNVGVGAGSVAAGDDPRLAYTQLQIDNFLGLKADKTNVLQLDNTTSYTPSANYHPATKKYVDDTGSKRLASGGQNIGDINPSVMEVTVSIGITLPNTNYQPHLCFIGSGGTPGDDATFTYCVRDLTTTSFKVVLRELGSNNQTLYMKWIIFGD
jgi:hypothetical protein